MVSSPHLPRLKRALLAQVLAQTETSYALGRLGDFAAAFAHPHDHILLASTDGVGTKTMLASMLGRHDDIGADLVHHGINDLLAMGAQPLVLLDYLGYSAIHHDVQHSLLTGLAVACQAHKVALIGGETSQMDLYPPGQYDLVGTIIGSAAPHVVLDGRRAHAGDYVLGLPSDGLHTNGYTLARTAFSEADLTSWVPELDAMLGAALLVPHRCYLPAIAPLLEMGVLTAMAHITGGGLPGNLPRQLSPGLGVHLDRGAWRVPPLFEMLQEMGNVPPAVMWATCNQGIGFCVFCAPADVSAALRALPTALPIGEVIPVEGASRVLGLPD